MDLQETQAVALVEVSEHGASVTLNGISYMLRQLTLNDYAIVEAYIRTQRLNCVRDMIATALNPVTGQCLLAPEVQSDAISKTICQRIEFADIWHEFDGEIAMLARALVGNAGISEGKGLAFVKNTLPPIQREQMVSILLRICGLDRPLGQERGESKKDNADPAISPPSDPSSGTGNSAPSAATSR